MRRRQIGLLQGEFFEADKVQALQRRIRLGLAKVGEGLPQREEIEPGAEPGFRHHQQRARVGGETLRELVALQEDVAGFFQPILIGKIDVIKLFRNRCTLFVPG